MFRGKGKDNDCKKGLGENRNITFPNETEEKEAIFEKILIEFDQFEIVIYLL
jgi:hypothetical protein